MTPEARARAIAELEQMEQNPPTVELTPEAKAELEAEKRALLEAVVPPKSDAGRIRGAEGSAIKESGPVRPPGWKPEDATYQNQPPSIRELPGRAVRIQDTGVVAVREIGDFSAAKLARLLKQAKAAQKTAQRQRDIAEGANLKAQLALAELDEYMADNGLSR